MSLFTDWIKDTFLIITPLCTFRSRAEFKGTMAFWVNTVVFWFQLSARFKQCEQQVSKQQLANTDCRAPSTQCCRCSRRRRRSRSRRRRRHRRRPERKQRYKAVESVCSCPAWWSPSPSSPSGPALPFWNSSACLVFFFSSSSSFLPRAHYKHIQTADVTHRLLMTRIWEITCHASTNSER